MTNGVALSNQGGIYELEASEGKDLKVQIEIPFG